MERNVSLDYFKILLSILVITIHLDALFPENLGYWLISNGIARIAVPFFFIVNGYFFASKINDSRFVKKYLIHLIIIYTTWFIIYMRPFLYKSEQLWILSDFRVDLILENYFWGIFHLWYIPSLIIGILLLVLMKKIIKNNNVLLATAIILFIVGYSLETFLGKQPTYNGILFCFGFPFIAFGYYISDTNLQKKVNNSYLVPILIIGICSLLLESYFVYSQNFIRNIYLSLIVVCPCIFLFILKHSKYKGANTYTNYLGSMASAIYFVHFYIISISFGALSISPISRLFVVIVVSIIASIIIVFINKRIKIFL